ncbi:MAG: class I SAM-dependent RNA methyltransferase [Pyrinomonadaceae bacterium]|nr:class I SAM-dependent RNA methyltransferase [Pyrinomonadaceae bacterium]
MKKRKRPRAEHGKRSDGRRAREEDAGAQLEVSIERILPGGAGLAHADGRTLLVSLAAPGDSVRVAIERTSGSVSFASITEILEPSPARVEPPCPYFGRCGGCDFQQLSYDAQLSAKQEIISDCLRRLARFEISPREIPITGSPLQWQYRARAQWQHDARAHRLGYFERTSHRVCDVAACPVLAPPLQETFTTLRQAMQDKTLPANITELQSVAGDEGTSLSPSLDDESPREVSRTIDGHTYRFSADGFFQINHELLPSLVAAATSEAQGTTAVDLYCGVGLFTLPLTRRFAHVTGIEANPAAINYARRNLSGAHITNATFECARVGEYLDSHAQELAPVDLVLLDPPRAGAEPQAISGILALRPERIVYVSCDPATLARDLRALMQNDYQLETIAAFDMFPQTHHVETIARLKRNLS